MVVDRRRARGGLRRGAQVKPLRPEWLALALAVLAVAIGVGETLAARRLATAEEAERVEPSPTPAEDAPLVETQEREGEP